MRKKKKLTNDCYSTYFVLAVPILRHKLWFIFTCYKKVPYQSILKIEWIFFFLISSYENLAFGTNEERLKFRAEGENTPRCFA